ncbi:sigma 54 modulation/S30EA ribosomal C-terminal domain-containing protein [Amycolatopsis sp. NPDC051903]|uniref:sigma 54 modulation/S30EA ribosomal C-terminal domain-containing protein n=1 Tax=Amycolatopsis sp. NPDC051903 TaxID=3363936 RepID=UPI00379DBCF8
MEWEGPGRAGEPASEIVRHKSFTFPKCTIDDAARDMGLLDYDFHLFTEVGTAVLRHAEESAGMWRRRAGTSGSAAPSSLGGNAAGRMRAWTG